MDKRIPLRSVTVIVVLSLVWAVLLALNIIPQLRGDFGWRWPYAVPPAVSRVWPFVISLGMYLLGTKGLFRRSSAWGLLGWAILGGVVLTLTGLAVAYDPFYQLYSITIGLAGGGWHYAASHISDLGDTLRRWPEYMPEAVQTVSSHLGIAPPGAVVVYWVANQLMALFPGLANLLGQPLRAAQCHQFRLLDYTNAQFASAWLGLLTPLWASLTVFPLYTYGRRMFGEGPARWAVVWWPLVPSLLMFTPTPYTLYPFFSIIILGLTLEGLQHDRPTRLLFAGLLTSAMMFVTFAFTALVLIAGLLALGLYWTRPTRRPWHWPFRMGIWFGLGLAGVWAGFYGLTGVGVWDILREARAAHLGLERPYWPWLVLHLNDFFMFTGWPLTLLAGWGAWQTLKRLRARGQPPAPGEALTLATFSAVVALDLAGVFRGETGRILLFLSPALLLAAAATFAKDPAPTRLGWGVTATQAVMACVMVLFLRVISSEFNTPPPAPPVVQSPTRSGFSSEALFENALRLESFAGQVVNRTDATGQSQPAIELWLDWRSTGQVDVPYYLSFIAVTPDGQALPAAELQQPFGGAYPTTCWLPASGLIRLQADVPVSATSAPGDWWISLALVNAQTDAKAQVRWPDGSTDDQVGLGPFSSP